MPSDDKKPSINPPRFAEKPLAEKPLADFSDVQSGSSTTAPAAQPAAERRTYTVKSGDTLSKIAKQHLGDANKWRAIFEANRDKIKDPDLIHPGQELTIPNA